MSERRLTRWERNVRRSRHVELIASGILTDRNFVDRKKRMFWCPLRRQNLLEGFISKAKTSSEDATIHVILFRRSQTTG
jgi:hypothetical protein